MSISFKYFFAILQSKICELQAKNFFHFVSFILTQFLPLTAQNLFSFMKSYLSIVSLNFWVMKYFKSFLHIYLVGPSSFSVSSFTLRPLIYQKLILMKSIRYKSNFSIPHGNVQNHCLRCHLFPVCNFGNFVKYQMAVVEYTHVWIFYFVSLIHMFLCKYHAAFITTIL